MSLSPQELKKVMSSGLLSFPITDFDADGNFNAKQITHILTGENGLAGSLRRERIVRRRRHR